MNDRFKTRIWHKETKTMHYNDFVISSTGYAAKVIVSSDSQCLIDQSDLIFDKNCVVMQCTGLQDKNGNLIYEGDITKHTIFDWRDKEYSRFSLIVWDRTKWQIGLLKYQRPKAQPNRRYDRMRDLSSLVCFDTNTPPKMFAEVEVIGNIYETPELLKDGE